MARKSAHISVRPSLLLRASAASASHSRVAIGTVGRARALARQVATSLASWMALSPSAPSCARTERGKSSSGNGSLRRRPRMGARAKYDASAMPDTCGPARPSHAIRKDASSCGNRSMMFRPTR